MKRSLLAAAVAAIVTIAPLAASAQLAGSALTGSMNQNLDSGSAYVGETFSISGASTPDRDMTGVTIYGHVDDVQRAGQGRSGELHLAFDKLYTRSGRLYRISGYASHVQIVTKSNAGKEALSTAGGALVGGLLGHGIGAVIGGGTGYAISKNSRENVSIAQGSPVTVQITHAYRQGT
jgi:hypothetical protein